MCAGPVDVVASPPISPGLSSPTIRIRRFSLRIEIDQADAKPLAGQSLADVHDGGRLSDSTFLVCHCDDGHLGSSLQRRLRLEKTNQPQVRQGTRPAEERGGRGRGALALDFR